MWMSREVVLIAAIPILTLIMVVSLAKRWSFGKTFGSLVFTVYIAAVVTVVFMPFPIKLMPGEPCSDFPINLTPFATISHEWETNVGTDHFLYFFRLVIGNVLLFIPLGFLAPYLWKRLREAKFALVLFLSIPACIELLQLVNGVRIGSLYRSVDVDDVLLNFTGALIGYAAFRFAAAIQDKWQNKRHVNENACETT